jgi:sporulation protein YtfJ
MSNEHPIDNLMKSTMESLRDMIDVNTVIGDAVETKDGSYIIPISRVCFGFASGGSEFPDRTNPDKLDPKYPFGGGSGAGVTVKPVAFLVVKEDCVRLLPVDHDSTCDRIVDTVPQVIDMFKDLFKKATSNNYTKTNSYDSTDSSCKLDDN